MKYIATVRCRSWTALLPTANSAPVVGASVGLRRAVRPLSRDRVVGVGVLQHDAFGVAFVGGADRRGLGEDRRFLHLPATEVEQEVEQNRGDGGSADAGVEDDLEPAGEVLVEGRNGDGNHADADSGC